MSKKRRYWRKSFLRKIRGRKNRIRVKGTYVKR